MNIKVLFLKKRILEDIKYNWTISELANQVKLSNSQLIKIFKEEFGKTPIQFVREIRLEESKRLLESNFLRIKEVMALAGFSDISHFVRDFKDKFGVMPSEYRKNFHERLL